MKPRLTRREKEVLGKQGTLSKKDYQTLYRLREKGKDAINYLLFLQQNLPEKQLKLIFKQNLAEPLIWTTLYYDKNLANRVYCRLYMLEHIEVEKQNDGKYTFFSKSSGDYLFHGVPTEYNENLRESKLKSPWERFKHADNAAKKKAKRLSESGKKR